MQNNVITELGIPPQIIAAAENLMFIFYLFFANDICVARVSRKITTFSHCNSNFTSTYLVPEGFGKSQFCKEISVSLVLVESQLSIVVSFHQVLKMLKF